MPDAAKPALDSQYRVETPEGIDLVLSPAGIAPRALAFAIDLAIRLGLLLLLILISLTLGQFGWGLLAIAGFILMWWYMVLFEVLNQGRSPGKALLKIKVVHDDGTPVTWAASLTRNLLRVVDIMPFAYGFGILSCLSHPAFKRLGDIAAGTLVIYQTAPVQSVELPEINPAPCPWPLSPQEQRAFLSFAQRSAHLSDARREELASLLTQELGVPAAQAPTQLHAIARSLLGERQ